MARSLTTPFRERYERSRQLDLRAQIEECVDYLQHPEVLAAEFFESYYLVEGKLDPEREDEGLEALSGELVLEPFFDSLELLVQAGDRLERVRCLAGAFAPLSGELHPALEQQGVDYVGAREGSERVVLGVSDASGEASVFSLLLRGLNCLAELTPPFQWARLRRHVLRERLDPEGSFDLQLCLASLDPSPDSTALLLLTRDLAEIFKQAVAAEPQFSDAVGRIECLDLGAGTPSAESAIRVRWRA